VVHDAGAHPVVVHGVRAPHRLIGTPLGAGDDGGRLAGKEFYTEAELTEAQQRERQRLNLNVEEGRPTEPGTAADVHYDFAQFGLDRGQAKMVWNRRTSLITGPEGTMPPMTPEARKRIAEVAAKNKGHELRPEMSMGARCLLARSAPPRFPAWRNCRLWGRIWPSTEMIHDRDHSAGQASAYLIRHSSVVWRLGRHWEGTRWWSTD
jgi:hypothetical protein